MNTSVDAIHDAFTRISTFESHAEFAKKNWAVPSGRTFVISLGKTARGSLGGLVSVLGTSISEAICIDDRVNAPGADVFYGIRVKHVRGNHPIPKSDSLAAASAIHSAVSRWDLCVDDAVIVCVGGGTSSMVAEAKAPLKQCDLGFIYRALLDSGIDVTSANTLRRKLTTLHDGGLAKLLYPARVTTLLMSDNAQGDMAAVGSGPTLLSKEPVAPEAIKAVPPHLLDSVRMVLEGVCDTRTYSGSFGRGDDEVYELANVKTLAEECTRSVQKSVDRVSCLGVFGGDWRLLAVSMWNAAAEMVFGPTGGWVGVIAAGEPCVTVQDGGRGGRCQQMTAAMAYLALPGVEFTFAAISSDGRDNIEGIRGAACDSKILNGIVKTELYRSLCETDTYDVLDASGCLLRGPRTDENLCDAFVLIARKVL